MTRAASLPVRVLTRMGSAAVLAGLLGGIPWGLVVLVGWPLPREVNLPQTVEDVQGLLSTPLTDQMIVNLLAVAMWLIWASFAASFAGEAIAAVRGVPSRRLPVVSPMQKVAGWLLSGVTAGVLAAAVFTPAVVAPPPPPAAAAAPAAPAPAPPTVTVSLTTAAFPQAAQEEQQPVVCAGEHVLHIDGQRYAYLVQHDDSLWAIAELCLGDGAEWPRIWELNRGRHFPDVGGTLRHQDLIYPGWDLYLPSDAAPPPDAEPVEPDQPEPPAEPAEPEPTPPSPTGPGAQDGPQAPAPATPTATTPSPPPATGTPAPSPTTSAGAGAGQTPAPSGEPDGGLSGGQNPDDRSPADTVLPVTAVLATAGLLTALVLARLRHHRGRRQQHRRHGRRLAEPDPAVETTTRVAAQPADVARLDHALRALAAALHGADPWQLPDVVAVWMDTGTVHLLLAAPCPHPPPPYVAGGGDMTWTLPADAALPELVGQLAPLPTLATVASHPHGQHLLVDVERAGLLTITGDPDRRADLLRYLAAEAATADWVDDGEVILVGFCSEQTAQLIALNEERVRGGASVDDAVARVLRRAAANQAALADAGCGNAFAGRINDIAADAWMPHLLIVADPEADLTGLDQTLHGAPRSAVAVAAAADQPASWNIHIDEAGRVSVDWLSVAEAYAAALPADQLARLAPMLRTARSLLPPDEAGFDEPVPPAPDEQPWAAGTDLHGHLLAEPDPDDELLLDEQLAGGADAAPMPVETVAGDDQPQVLDPAPEQPDAEAWPEVSRPPTPPGPPPVPLAPGSAPPVLPDQDGIPEPPVADPALRSPAVTFHDSDDQTGPDEATGAAEPAESISRLLPAFAAPAGEVAQPAATVAPATRRRSSTADPDLDADLADWHAPTLEHRRPRISILGPVEVGASGPPPADRLRFYSEVIVYLAQRGRRGAAPDELDEAIWPGGVAFSSRRVAMSKIRIWLDESHDGQQWLPPGIGGDRTYRIRDGYLFDWHLFRRLRTRGEARGAAGTGDLRRALELVRGVPLDGADRPYHLSKRSPYTWLPGSTVRPHHLASAMVDTAHQLVEQCLAAGDTETARWAVEQAWLADPGKTDDHPWLDLMRIHVADGHTSALRTLLEQLMEAREVEVPEELNPHTFQAIDTLAGDLLRVS